MSWILYESKMELEFELYFELIFLGMDAIWNSFLISSVNWITIRIGKIFR